MQLVATELERLKRWRGIITFCKESDQQSQWSWQWAVRDALWAALSQKRLNKSARGCARGTRESERNPQATTFNRRRRAAGQC